MSRAASLSGIWSVLTAQQALELDRQSFSQDPSKSYEFIERAGALVAEWILKSPRFNRTNSQVTVHVLVGPGHNGADGYVAARVLHESRRFKVEVYVYQEPRDELVLRARELAVREGVTLKGWGEVLVKQQGKCTQAILIDALFGVGIRQEGLSSDLFGELFSKIEAARKMKKIFVLAIDTPSGLDAGTGCVGGVCLRANVTLAMGHFKLGHFQNEGPAVTGRLYQVHLPYSASVINSIAPVGAVGKRFLKLNLPGRSRSGNKASFGHVCVIAGSMKYPGAGVLACRAALAVGAGYVHWFQLGGLWPEWLTIPEVIPESGEVVPDEFLQRPATYCVGPGVVDQKRLKSILIALESNQRARVIVDAGGLSVFAGLGRKASLNWVFTPHPKELGEMLGLSIEHVQKNRLAAIKNAQSRFGGVFVLKGYKTLITDGEKVFVSLRGNSNLAKAGSGDVLAGLISGLLAQKSDEVLLQTTLAVVLHALAADEWCQHSAGRSLTPSQLIEMVPLTLKKL